MSRASEHYERERTRLLMELKDYVDNYPLLLSDLKRRIEPLMRYGYANLPEVLIIVNAKIFPLKVVISDNGSFSHSVGDILGDLKIIDTRDNDETLRSAVMQTASTPPPLDSNIKMGDQHFYGPVGTVGHNHGDSVAEVHSGSARDWRISDSLPARVALAIIAPLLVAFLVYRLGWS